MNPHEQFYNSFIGIASGIDLTLCDVVAKYGVRHFGIIAWLVAFQTTS